MASALLSGYGNLVHMRIKRSDSLLNGCLYIIRKLLHIGLDSQYSFIAIDREVLIGDSIHPVDLIPDKGIVVRGLVTIEIG